MTVTPPHSIDAERAVLGAILYHAPAIADVLGLVEPRDFFHPAHEAIFAAALALDAAGRPIDSLSVAGQMRADDTIGRLRAVNGEAYFADLATALVTHENAAFHARMVAGRAVVRRVVEAAREVAARGMGDYGDLDAYLADADRQIAAALDTHARQEPLSFGAVQRESVTRLEERAARRGQLTGITSGMREYDESSGGWHETELTLCAARPGVGKTAWAMFVSVEAARSGVPVLFVSLEMDRRALFDRYLSGAARIPGAALRKAAINPPAWQSIFDVSSEARGLPLWIDDETSQTIAAIRGKVRRWRTRTAPPDKHPRALVVVDYVQLIAGTRERNANRAEEVGTFSAGLKNLARELRIPVIALAQLNRAVEARGDKRPVLADLRESGNLEQDSDNVTFLYRPALHDKAADREHAELIIGKARNGPCGTVALRWQEQYTRYSDESERNS